MMAALYALLCLIWGSTWLVIKISLAGVPPFLGAGLRFLLSASVLFGLMAARRTRLVFDRDDKIAILSCGLLSFTLSYGGVYWAEQYISSGLTAVLYCLMPLFVAVLSRFWTKAETLSRRKIVGIVVAIVGTVLLFRPAAASSRAELAGMGVALASAAAASISLVLLKRHSLRTDIYTLNACGMGIGACCLLAISGLSESYAALSWTPANVLAIVYLALAGSVTAFLVYTHLIKVMDATRLSLISLIIPIVAVALGAAFLGEKVSSGAAVGMIVVLAGVGTALLRPD